LLSYRNDIDGLRAIAVSLVILHHLGLSEFSGGFVGVDVFFVISGFVIFRGILTTGIDNFSIKDFYKRRIRRILPALLVTIFLTYLVGLVLLTPYEMQTLLESGMAAALSLSNLYFHDNAENYFSPAAATLPLLHTWSLGVEEQFYILVPILFLLLRKAGLSVRNIVVSLTVVIVLTFLLNVFAVHALGKFNDAFYLPITRFWEIAMGAIVAVFEFRSKSLLISVRRLLFLMGCIGLFTSVFVFDKTTAFPGYSALLPVLSTSLIIWVYSDELWLARATLKTSPMMYVGKISYSLYLFHWPVIVYMSLYLGRSLHTLDMLLAVTLTALLAILTTKFLEEPLRRKSIGVLWGELRIKVLVGILSIIFISLSGLASSGFAFRLNQEAYTVFKESTHDANSSCAASPKSLMLTKAEVCSVGNTEFPFDYALWGDSHALMYRERLFDQFISHNFSAIYYGMPDCQPLIGVITNKEKNRDECRKLSQEILEKVHNGSLKNIIVSARWATLGSPVLSPGDGEPSKLLYNDNHDKTRVSFEEALTSTVKALSSSGAHVFVIGPAPEIDYSVPETLIRSLQLNLQMPLVEFSNFLERQDEVLSALLKIETLDRVTVLYPHQLLCDAHTCKTVVDGKPLYSDDDHLSVVGVNYLMPYILEGIELKNK
jgi:peptidoglycan/LPS O-acetylase OafA/YrhL